MNKIFTTEETRDQLNLLGNEIILCLEDLQEIFSQNEKEEI